MKISIKDFLSLKNVELEIEKGLTVIAGQNGSGKTQLFLGIAHNDSKYLLSTYGYGDLSDRKNMDEAVKVNPKPGLVLFRPPVRKLAEANKDKREAVPVPFNSIINASASKQGYSYGDSVQNRYIQLYAILSNIYIAGNISGAKANEKNNWHMLCESFNNVFDKELCGEYKTNGATVGIRLSDNTISSMNTLSTGELEFISLLCDLIIENDETDSQKADLILIDELDAHFHPDLQLKVIKTIEHLCVEKYVLITTHSPSVMMSVANDRLFYLNHFSKCKNKSGEYDNQIEPISRKYSLYQKLYEMYNTLMTDLDMVDFYSKSSNNAILKFAEEGLSEDSTALPANSAKDGDLQISSLKHIIANNPSPEIIEVGCGVGRTLAMFKGFEKKHLSKISYIGFDIRPENVSCLNEYINSEEISELGLKSVAAAIEIDEATSGNLCIFANVIHEIYPDSLAPVLNGYLRTLKPESTSLILEVLELNVGEKAFVMQYPESIGLIFERLKDNEILEFVVYTDNTRTGIPLMYVNILIKDPTLININNEDVLKSLNEIVTIETQTLREHYFNPSRKLNATSYSFHSHNLANALTFINILGNPINDNNTRTASELAVP